MIRHVTFGYLISWWAVVFGFWSEFISRSDYKSLCAVVTIWAILVIMQTHIHTHTHTETTFDQIIWSASWAKKSKVLCFTYLQRNTQRTNMHKNLRGCCRARLHHMCEVLNWNFRSFRYVSESSRTDGRLSYIDFAWGLQHAAHSAARDVHCLMD